MDPLRHFSEEVCVAPPSEVYRRVGTQPAWIWGPVGSRLPSPGAKRWGGPTSTTRHSRLFLHHLPSHSLQAFLDSASPLPNTYDTRTPALPAVLMLHESEGITVPCVRKSTQQLYLLSLSVLACPCSHCSLRTPPPPL